MKTITIKNIELQFDSVDAGADQHTALSMIDRLNEELPHVFNGQQPQILIDGKEVEFEIKDSDR